jgi:hypothetical protein
MVHSTYTYTVDFTFYQWLKQDNDPKADFPRLWTSDEFMKWWQGSARRYIDDLAANAATDFFNSY